MSPDGPTQKKVLVALKAVEKPGSQIRPQAKQAAWQSLESLRHFVIDPLGRAIPAALAPGAFSIEHLLRKFAPQIKPCDSMKELAPLVKEKGREGIAEQP